MEYFFEHCFVAKRAYYPKEYKTAIDQTLVWYNENLRPNVDKLIKNLIAKAAGGASGADAQNEDEATVEANL